MIAFWMIAQITHAYQQSGFKREKRYGVPRSWPSHPEVEHSKRSPWVDLRQALDEEDQAEYNDDGLLEDQGPNYDPHIVHDEGKIEHLLYSTISLRQKCRLYYYTPFSHGQMPLDVTNISED